MRRNRPYDPLACLPSSEIVASKLAETETLAEKLRVLLRLTREVEGAGRGAAERAKRAEVAHAG
jgi:hypothetical protein